MTESTSTSSTFDDYLPAVERASHLSAALALGNTALDIDAVVNHARAVLWQLHQQGKLDSINNIESWAFTISRHEAIRLLRQRKSQSEPYPSWDLQDHRSFSPLDEIQRSEAEQDLQRLLHKLSLLFETRLDGEQHKLSRLIVHEGMNLREAAHVLDISHSAARKRWSRLMKDVSVLIRHELDDDPYFKRVLSPAFHGQQGVSKLFSYVMA